jgi:drug/metabolite transporter (DMT)-like permease
MVLSDTDLGLVAGLATAALWATTAMLFTGATRRLGATTTNATRIALAVAILAALQWWRTSGLLPELSTRQWVELALSGVIGLSLCDQALFVAFGLIGPRRVMLLQTTTPLFALAMGVVLLDERVGGTALLGVLVTLLGVSWVVLERSPAGGAGAGGRRDGGGRGDGDGDGGGDAEQAPKAAARHQVERASRAAIVRRGWMLAALAALLQAVGALLAKRGMGHGWLPPEEHVDPLTTTYVRMIFGSLGVVPLVLHAAWRKRRALAAGVPLVRPTLAEQRARGWLCVGAATVLGPVLGVWMSMEAFDRVAVGVAQTLIGLSPVLILPLVAMGGERVSARAVMGALVAVAGSAVLFLT